MKFTELPNQKESTKFSFYPSISKEGNLKHFLDEHCIAKSIEKDLFAQ
jgi:hypothetical protein